MKILKKFNIKKILKLLRIGTFKKSIFFILFGMYFSTLAFAAALTVSFKGGLIPGGNNNFINPDSPKCRSSTTGDLLTFDRTTDPSDVQFSDDGFIVFSTNMDTSGMQNNTVSMNKLDRPFDIDSDRVKGNTNATCDDVDGTDTFTLSDGVLDRLTENIDIVNNGRTFLILDRDGLLGKFNASTAFDLDGLTYVENISLGANIDSVAFNRDGTKLFTLSSQNDTPTLTTLSLPGPYDLSSSTQIHQVDLTSNGITDTDGETEVARDIEFNADGSAMFILISNNDDLDNQWIYHYDLKKNYDVSTAVKVDRWQVGAVFLNRTKPDTQTFNGMPRGIGFSSDGMVLFITDIRTTPGGTGVDRINGFDLECPYGLVKCSSDSMSSIGSQVELAKQNITLNISTIFKRFEWIKRNRDEEDLTSHNFNIDFPDPLLKSLAVNLEPKAKKKIASLVSKNHKKDKKSKWSTWSLVELSMSDFRKLGFQQSKSIKTKGLTFGSDRKFGDNKFLGLALRYADNKSNIDSSIQNTELESLTLNLYGIAPTNENRYMNVVLGLSALRFDNKYSEKLSGSRNGKQVFTSINYRTKNTFSSLNITPTGKFTYGVTRLSEFTDFFSMAIDRPTNDIKYAEDTFKSGELAAGFLFDANKIKVRQGSFQPMGGVEILYDLTPNINYKYNYQGATPVNTEKIIGKYSQKSLKTNIGFEAIFQNGLTISPSYERIITMNNDHRPDRKKGTYTERFIIKVSQSKEDDGSQFALNIDPISDNPSSLNFSKKYDNFLINFSSNYSLFSKIPEYGANIEISGTF